MDSIKVIGAKWQQERGALKQIRQQVFINEQGVPANLEWDGLDDTAEHFIAYINSEAVGCARLIEHKKIGRMAVLKPFRNRDIGRKILDHIKRFASQKRYTLLQLSAQCHAYAFYRQCGFSACSQPYSDANIAHIDMECRVFGDNSNQQQYAFTQDHARYLSPTQVSTQGYFEIMLSQCRNKITICLNNLSSELSKDPGLISKIKFLARRNRHLKINVLLNHYHPSNNDHELFKLMNKLPSFVEVRQNLEVNVNKWQFDDTASLEINSTQISACYADRANAKKFTELFNRWWHHAKAIQSARRLSI